ncbi:MAG: hypothetical protein O3C27_07845 [Actinomycetota bacterium]|nr:hypothetical protein [Actinomycetota bacterium]
MQWELGPVAADQVQWWSRTARRLVLELRTDPEQSSETVTPELLDAWSNLIDRWSAEASAVPTFRWSAPVDDDQAEFLLHGLKQCLKLGDIDQFLTSDDIQRNRDFTVLLVESIIGGLEIEGRRCEHFADEMRDLLTTRN